MTLRCWLAAAVALLLLLGSAASRAQPEPPFAIRPYLLDVTSDSATVAFQLTEPLRAAVSVPAGGAERRFESPAGRAHFVRVTGLEPGQIYPYQVHAGAGATPPADPRYEIRSAGRPGESFTFVVYGDPRPGENQTHRHHRLLVEQMLLLEPAFALVLGDLVDDGSDAGAWRQFFEVEAELRGRSAIYPVLGDNDYAGGRGLWAEHFPGGPATGPYHFEWGGVHFFGLRAWGTLSDQPESEVDEQSEQVRWLTEQLGREEVAGAPFRVVFVHDPIYLSRGRSSEVLRRVWGPLLSRTGVDLVFASWHLYERSRHDGVTYIISGGGGAELVWLDPNPAFPSQAEARRHHFVRADVKPGALQLRAVAEDGTVIDALTLFPRSVEGESGAAELQRVARRLGREIVLGRPQAGEPELGVHLFSYDCGYCRRLLERELPRLAEEQGVALRIRHYDLGLPGAYDLLMAAGADFGRQDAPIPTVLLGRTALGGEAEISTGLPAELQLFRADPKSYNEQAFVPFTQAHDTKTMRRRRFESLSLAVVLAAGLIDGVNPCAFTTIIFLLSYLSVAGGSRRQILLTGGVFTLAVFLTYLAIGVLFYQVAGALMGSRTVATAVNLIMLLALGLLASLSARDAVRAWRGRPTDMSLKLPRFLQDRIRARIRTFARSNIAVTSASFSLGVVIAGMELACTGQIYVPIVTMIAEPRYRATASLHLLAYNLAFIVPLVVVFLLAVLGLTSARLARFAGRHVASAKLALALLFAGLCVVVLYNLGWIG